MASLCCILDPCPDFHHLQYSSRLRMAFINVIHTWYKDNTDDRPSLHTMLLPFWTELKHSPTSCDIMWLNSVSSELFKLVLYYWSLLHTRVCVGEGEGGGGGEEKGGIIKFTTVQYATLSIITVKSTKLFSSQLTSFQHCWLYGLWGRERERWTAVHSK